MTKIYNYDAKTGEFLSTSEADKSPLEPGVYLLPSNATTIAPPAVAARECAVFTGREWVKKPDWRGVSLYHTADGSEMRIGEIGQTPEDVGATEVQPLEPQQRQAWLNIQAVRDGLMSGGVRVENWWFHSDDTSRIQYLALERLKDDLPKNTMWKTRSGEFVSLTPELVATLFKNIIESDLNIFTIAEKHKAEMLKSDAPLDYDFSQGWPKTFERATNENEAKGR